MDVPKRLCKLTQCEYRRITAFSGYFCSAGRVAKGYGAPYNYSSLKRAVSSGVRAPRSHRGGRRFKSSIAHHYLIDVQDVT